MTGIGAVRAGACADATRAGLPVRFDATGGCARDATLGAEGAGRGALPVRAICVRRVESLGRVFDARPAAGVGEAGARALAVERAVGFDR